MENLQNTESPISRAERNKINGNWDAIQQNFNSVNQSINHVDNKVNDAVTIANQAEVTAVDAKTIAEGIDGKVNQAVTTSNEANVKSDNAVDIATQKGDASIAIANQKGDQSITIATQKGNEAITIANQANETSDYVQNQLDTVILENGDANPEVAQARSNFVSLRDRLDTQHNEVTTQLAHNHYELESKRSKTDKIELEDLSEYTLSAISGNAEFNLLSIPQDDSVTKAKIRDGEVSLIKRTIDIFPHEKTEWLRYGYHTLVIGEPSMIPTSTIESIYKHDTIDVYQVIGGTTLSVTINSDHAVAFHSLDINKLGVSDSGWITTSRDFVLPANASFIRFVIKRSDNSEFTIDEVERIRITVEKKVSDYMFVEDVGINASSLKKIADNNAVNLISINNSSWEQGSVAPTVELKPGYDEATYSNSKSLLRIKREKALRFDGTPRKLHVHIDNKFRIRFNAYDADGNFVLTYNYGLKEIDIPTDVYILVPIVGYTDGSVITPNEIEQSELYIGLSEYKEDLNITSSSKKIIPCPLVESSNSYKYIGHAVMTAYGPENTLENLEICRLLDMWGVETDVRLTSDGEIVLMHDKTVDRTTNGTGNVSDLTLAQIKEFNIDLSSSIYQHDVKVPTLDAFLEKCVSYNIRPVIEIKTDEPNINLLITKLIKVLSKHNLIDKSIVISFSKEIISSVRQQSPLVWVAPLISGVAITNADIMYAQSIGNCALFSYNNSQFLNKEIIRNLKNKNIPIIYGTADDYAIKETVKEYGVDGIVTNKFYDYNKPSQRFVADIRTVDAGLTWEVTESLNGLDLNFDTSDMSELRIKLNNIPYAWMVELLPYIEVTNYSGRGNLLINSFFDANFKSIVLTFIYNGAKVNLGELNSYVKFRINVLF